MGDYNPKCQLRKLIVDIGVNPKEVTGRLSVKWQHWEQLLTD